MYVVFHMSEGFVLHLQHTDLHPGNILVRVRPPTRKEAADAADAAVDDLLLAPIAPGKAKPQLQLVSAF